MTAVTPPVAARVLYPLRPLTEEEITRAVEVVRSADAYGPSVRFVHGSLREPAKDVLARWDPDTPPPNREADVVLYDRATSRLHEVVVSLPDGQVTAWSTRPGAQPSIMLEEALETEALVKADPRWQEALRKRGITDPALTRLDPWPVGHTSEADAPDRRRCILYTWAATGPDDNYYARPIDGVVVVVDLDRNEVVEVEDHGVVPVPDQPGNYRLPGLLAPENRPRVDALRTDLREIRITQPEGASFTVDDHAVRWGPWSFHVGWNGREGLVLHDLRYDDRGTVRRLFDRLSVSEMVVPYADPGPNHYRKVAFDEGEIGLGVSASSLELGCDCLGEIHYFDAAVTDQDGEVLPIPNAVCMHEEDMGVGWKHFDFLTETSAVSRARRLVVSTFVNVGNYDYGFFWYLHLDGGVELEVKLTGIISTGAFDPAGPRPPFGTPVAPGLYGPNHQHFFCVRIDPAIDGPANSVVEVNSEMLPPGDDNPYGTAWRVVETPLRTEAEAQRTTNPASARYWKIVNPGERNDLGSPVAYRLEPGPNVGLFVDPDSRHGRRAGFASRHLWVTPYRPDERFAAGAYPYQSPGGDGLPLWTEADRPVEDDDIVVWYVFGAHHVVRPEDWPVMPVTRIGFCLRPDGFFDGNPALDLAPPTPAHASAHDDGCCAVPEAAP